MDPLPREPNPGCIHEYLSNPKVRIHEYPSNPKVTERVAEAERELSVYRERDGVFTKASVILNAKQMAPSEWWGLYGKHLPILSGVATKVLSQTVCASAAERNWSIYGRIKSKERAQLGHAKSDKLVYCHDCLLYTSPSPRDRG